MGQFCILHSLLRSPHRMVSDLVESFLAYVAILLSGKERWHTRDHIVIIVVV